MLPVELRKCRDEMVCIVDEVWDIIAILPGSQIV